MMMTTTFTNMTAYAQGFCAVSACSDMNSIILSLDAGILLASIIILLVVKSSSFRITAQQASDSP